MKEISVDKIILIDESQGRFTTQDKDLLLDYGRPLENGKYVEIEEVIISGENKCGWFQDVVVYLKVDGDSYHFYYDSEDSIIRDNKQDVLKELL